TCAYGLLTRLFPERAGYVDTIAGQRLEAPLGYWNALGLFAAIGLLLAAGLVAPTLYFTFSRGGWVALAAGLAALVALDRRRLQFLAALAASAVWAAVAVW